METIVGGIPSINVCLQGCVTGKVRRSRPWGCVKVELILMNKMRYGGMRMMSQFRWIRSSEANARKVRYFQAGRALCEVYATGQRFDSGNWTKLTLE